VLWVFATSRTRIQRHLAGWPVITTGAEIMDELFGGTQSLAPAREPPRTRTSPVILLIEDLHWADRSTTDLLAFLIRNQPSLDGVLIVVTYRSDELGRTHPLRALLAEFGRIGWVARMDLGRLTRQDTDRLVAGIAGRRPGDELLAAVYRRTEGNPLFVEALVGGGDLGAGLPESLRDLLVASLRRLPEETQEVVRVASAGGERTGHGLLAVVTGMDSAVLARAVRPAVAANVLLANSDGYAFRHALIREAVHDELLPGERGQVHSRFAEAIGADPGLVEPGRAPAGQAYHWHAAHDATRALVSAWQAAGQAGHAVAYAEQLAMLARVLELWNRSGRYWHRPACSPHARTRPIRCSAPPSPSQTCSRPLACMNWPPRWPGRDSRRRGNTGSPGRSAPSWPATWPSH
jgi:hypothetical protein